MRSIAANGVSHLPVFKIVFDLFGFLHFQEAVPP